MKTYALSLVFFFYLCLAPGCMKKEDYPDVPHIKYERFDLISNEAGIIQRGVFTFSYTDGDGNIGLKNEETIKPYDYNLFISYFEKINGAFEEIFIIHEIPEGDTIRYDTTFLHGRIPMLTPEGKSKAIKGEISDTLIVNNPNSTRDTIQFKLYIMDRALNKSNTIQSPEIILNK